MGAVHDRMYAAATGELEGREIYIKCAMEEESEGVVKGIVQTIVIM